MVESVAGGAIVRNEVGVPGTGPVAFGSIAYAASSAAAATLVVPQVVVGRRGDRVWLTTMTTGDERLGHSSGERLDPDSTRRRTFADGASSPTQWAGAVAHAVELDHAGHLDKVAGATWRRSERPIDVRWLLARLAERYDNMGVQRRRLVGATPEMLARSEKGLVTCALAGTIRRTGDDEHDLALAASLARSSKDLRSTSTPCARWPTPCARTARR